VDATSERSTGLRIAAYSALILFFELAFIRYTAGYVRVFSFYLNFVLIATFLGMGVGLLSAKHVERLRWLAIPASLLLFGAVWYFSRVAVIAPDDPNEFLWGIFSTDLSMRRVPLAVMVPSLFLSCTLFFVPLGALLGEQFGKLPALRAYSWDIGGSLVGILTFALLSLFRLDPAVWFAIGFAAWGLASLSRRSFAIAIVVIGAVGSIAASREKGPREYWSPYYRIDVNEEDLATKIDVNGSLHQYVIDLDSMRSERFDYTRVVRRGYLLPHDWVGHADTVLVVGAGTGNDLSLALMRGAKHVDAVEIDPTIAKLGKELHKQRPYDDPRVHLHVDDARAFLRRTTQKYDLIIFGTLDSQTLLSGMSSVRLDNYVYTVESFASAKRRLREGGTLVVYHRSPQQYIAARIYQMVGEAFGEAPAAYFGEMNLFNVIFVAGAGAARVPANPGLKADLSRPVRLARDDWPYLYLRDQTIPGHYRAALASVLIVTVLLLGLSAGKSLKTGFDAPMFFMGAAFLLVETKSVTEMSLLFGSTWTVNILVFASILLMVFLANRLVSRGSTPGVRTLFACLLGSLTIAYVVPASDLLWLGTVGQWALGGLMVALPIFFASLIFSTLFSTRAESTSALAYNLLGAIVGGVLEYSSMAIGIKGLYVVAAALYGAAYLFATRRTLNPTP
jgi:spermidine synthase